jgi:putative transposase
VIANFQNMDRGFSMEALYKVAGISRQAIWQAAIDSHRVSIEENQIIDEVKAFRKNHPKMGSRVLFHSIKNTRGSLKIGINKFEALLSCKKLTIKRSKSWLPKTSDGKGKKDYKNLTNGLILNDINQLLVSDITYFRVEKGFYYIFTIKDVYSQRMLEILPARTLEAKHLISCLQNVVALRGQDNLSKCIFHSDNGSQYDANTFTKMLRHKLKMQISRAQSCQQNGSSEQSHHIVKNMYLAHLKVSTFEQLCKECKRIKSLINSERAVEQLGYLSPILFENSLANIHLNSRLKKVLHDFQTNT